MAINFPSSPVQGQVYEFGDYVYTFDGVKWTSVLKYGLAAAKVSSETPPPNPEAGLMWYVPSTGESYLWYDDGDSGQWIQETPSIGAVSHRFLEGVNEENSHKASAISLEEGGNVQGKLEELTGLTKSYLIAQGYSGNYGFFADGFTYSAEGDIGIDTNGNSWIYVGAGAPNKVVADGTVPSAPDYEQVTFDLNDIKAVARSLNVADSAVIYATNTTTSIGAGDGVSYIYDASNQTTWRLPSGIGEGETISSVTGSALVTSEGSYTLIIPSVNNSSEHYVESWGLIGDGVFDNSDNFDLMLSSIDTYPETGWYRSFGTIHFPIGKFYFSRPWNLKVGGIIKGSIGGVTADQGTVLEFSGNDVAAITYEYYNTLNDTIETSPSGGAFGAQLDGFSIIARNKIRGNHGLRLRIRAVIKNTSVSGFGGNGVHIEAIARSGDPYTEGNANSFRLEYCSSTDNGMNGYYCKGADANAGTMIGCNGSSNDGYGFYDSSFLGNMYYGCHTASNGKRARVSVNTGGSNYDVYWCLDDALADTVTPGTDPLVWHYKRSLTSANPYYPVWVNGGDYINGGSHKSDNSNAACLWELYTEGDQLGGVVNTRSITMGGLHGSLNETGLSESTAFESGLCRGGMELVNSKNINNSLILCRTTDNSVMRVDYEGQDARELPTASLTVNTKYADAGILGWSLNSPNAAPSVGLALESRSDGVHSGDFLAIGGLSVGPYNKYGMSIRDRLHPKEGYYYRRGDMIMAAPASTGDTMFRICITAGDHLTAIFRDVPLPA